MHVRAGEGGRVMNAFLLIFGAAILAAGIAAGRYFGRGKGWKWVNVTGDRDRYDEKAVLRFLSKSMYALGGCFGGGVLLGGALDLLWPAYAGMGLTLGVAVFMLVYMNTGGRFLKK